MPAELRKEMEFLLHVDNQVVVKIRCFHSDKRIHRKTFLYLTQFQILNCQDRLTKKMLMKMSVFDLVVDDDDGELRLRCNRLMLGWKRRMLA